MVRLDRFLTLGVFGPLSSIGFANSQRIPILMYHSISNKVEKDRHPYYHVVTTPEIFDQHMCLLADQGCQVIGLDTAVDLLQRKDGVRQSMLTKPIVITFDDGFLDFYTDAFPALMQHGFTATVFLPTFYITDKDTAINGKSFLSWSKVRELIKAGITFGSHTVSHNYLSNMKRVDVELELRVSKETIEEKTGMPAWAFSYPYAFPEQNKEFVFFLRNALLSCGYSCAVTTSIGTARSGDGAFFLKRIPINASDDSALLRAKLSGGYDWMHNVQYTIKSMRSMLGVPMKKSTVRWPAS